MEIETLLFFLGAIFTVIAIVGGGLEIDKLRIPSIGIVPRFFAFLVGIIFIITSSIGINQFLGEKSETAIDSQSNFTNNQTVVTSEVEQTRIKAEQQLALAKQARIKAEQETQQMLAEQARIKADMEEKVAAAEQARIKAEAEQARIKGEMETKLASENHRKAEYKAIDKWRDSFHKYPSTQKIIAHHGFFVKSAPSVNARTVKETSDYAVIYAVGYLDTDRIRFYISEWSWKRASRGHTTNWVFIKAGSEEQNLPTGTQPSWCPRASTRIELLICNNAKLWYLDNRMNELYKQIKPQGQRQWLRNVRAKCRNVSCLEQSYKERIVQIGGSY